MSSPGPAPHRRLVQAPVAAVDVDGQRVVAAGTVLFAVAAVVCLLLGDRWGGTGQGDWAAVCVAGTGLGLLGLLYCRHRVLTRRRGGSPT